MSLPLVITLILISLIVLVLILVYNQLVRHGLLTEEAKGGIAAGLQERHDLIPNLVATVKGYAGHENKTLLEVTKWRTQGMAATTIEEQSVAATGLNRALQQMQIVAENYPGLKADAHFLDLMAQLSRIENKLNDARRYYNGTVRDYNHQVLVFPKNIIAKMFGFQRRSFFAEDADAGKTPAINFNQQP